MVQGSLKDTTVCVAGLGYVRYPLTDAFARHLRTNGYDLDAAKITQANTESMIQFTCLNWELNCKNRYNI